MTQPPLNQPSSSRRPPVSGRYVVYWMQNAQRVEFNPALEYAVARANELAQPLLVYFGLTPAFPEAGARHYRFLLEGLQEVESALRERRIPLVIRAGSPPDNLLEIARRASLVVVDRGYLRLQRAWRESAAQALECPLVQAETDVVVPVETASSHAEYSAATLRPKIQRQLARFLKPVYPLDLKHSREPDFTSLDISDIEQTLEQLGIDRREKPLKTFRGGYREARRRLEEFLADKLERYAGERNDPNAEATSNLSPYLHFGQISPVYAAIRGLEQGGPGSLSFIEELVVRRELVVNAAFYNPDYDAYAGLPQWARRTLDRHRADPRPALYTREQLERAETPDPYWNAAQNEMLFTGKMHGYMRMYWGKKILEWSRSQEEAFQTAVYLNNRYELDGRDASGFAGIAWCFGLHDRPWMERAVFGNIRYMNEKGLKRKFDADRYAARFNSRQDSPP